MTGLQALPEPRRPELHRHRAGISHFSALPVGFLLYIHVYLGCTGSQVQYAGSSSRTREQTWLPWTGSVEPQPLDHLGRTLGIVGFQSDSLGITSSASNCHQFLLLYSRPRHPGWNTTARQWHTHQVVGVYSPTRRFPSSA